MTRKSTNEKQELGPYDRHRPIRLKGRHGQEFMARAIASLLTADHEEWLSTHQVLSREPVLARWSNGRRTGNHLKIFTRHGITEQIPSSPTDLWRVVPSLYHDLSKWDRRLIPIERLEQILQEVYGYEADEEE